MNSLRFHHILPGMSSTGSVGRSSRRTAGGSLGRSAAFRVAAGALLAASLVACGTTVAGTAAPDPAALASAAIGQVPTEVPTDIGSIPTDQGQPTAENESPADPGDSGESAEPGAAEAPDASEAPAEPDVTEPDVTGPEFPDDPEASGVPDVGDIPGFGELPEDWPADIVLPEGAVVSFGFSDETGITALFTVPGSTVADIGAFFDSSLPSAGYSADQSGEFSGVYSGIFTKDGVTVTVGVIDFGGEVTATVTISPS